jgi:hypothetical protein
MRGDGKKAALRMIVAAVAAGLLASAVPAPASAGFFDRLFGGLRRAVEAPAENIRAFVDPNVRLGNPGGPSQLPVENGPARAFCVRTCDGHYFPVQAHAGVSAAESCRSLCPASQTRLYSGSNIDYAVTNDGSRYPDLDNAFVYRKQMVAACTCNGHSPFGLARIDVNTDRTLRPGDIVATKSGLMAFTGARNNVADFTPVDSYRGMPKSARDKLSDVKIMPTTGAAPTETTSSIAPVTGNTRDDRRRVQLDR